MAYVREYSSEGSSVTWFGRPLFGLAPESGITVTRNNDVTDEEVGMQGGDATISILPDKSCTISLTFQQESEGHRILSDVLNRQEQNAEFFRGPLSVRINTGEVVQIPQAHIKSPAERTWGSTATGSGRTWTFYGNRLVWSSNADWSSVGSPIVGPIQLNI